VISNNQLKRDALENFLKHRKGDGSAYTKSILKALVEKKGPDGWVRACDLKLAVLELYPNCTDQTFYRLLGELDDLAIIDRRGIKRTQHERPGQVAVFYRLALDDKDIEFPTYEELAQQVYDLQIAHFDAESVLFRYPKIWDEYLNEKAETQKIREGKYRGVINPASR
jgi:hypothetical protein